MIVSQRTAGGATVARDLKVLRQAWRWAVECGHIPPRELPAVEVKRRDPVYSGYTPSRAEMGQLLAGATDRCRRALVLLACTGARVGEVAALTWSRVAVDCSSVILDGKTGPRAFPLHPTVQAELRTWTRGEPSARVTGHTTRSCVTKVQRHLADRSAEFGLPRVSPNGFRRAMTDALYNAGELPDVEAALLGHSAQTARLHYRKASEAHLKRAVLRSGVALPGSEGAVVDLAQYMAQGSS